MRHLVRFATATLAIVALFTAVTPSQAALNVGFIEHVTNGGFEGGTYGQVNYNGTKVPGWTVPGTQYTSYTFAANSSNISTGVLGHAGTLRMWDSRTNGSTGGLEITASPVGGNFITMDGNLPGLMSPIQQLLTHLVPGAKYEVSFYAGFAQQYLYYGDTLQRWDVSLGDETWSTPTILVPEHTFTGWQKYTHTFTAKSGTSLLKFAGWGNVPVPPFALLDGASVVGPHAPEPASIAIFGIGIATMGIVRRYRRPKVSA
ncbi:MAG: PEP-CTERM sorting domain-containing protein [Pirellula sp.]|jgi:hypothetical protein